MRSLILLHCTAMGLISWACVSEKSAQALLTHEPTPDAGILTVSSSCGGYMNPPRFAGQTVSRLADGSTFGLPNVKFLSVIDDNDPKKRQALPTDIHSNVNGQFDAYVEIATSSTVWSEGSKTPEQGGKIIKSEEWVDDVVFELQASGCDSLVVHFSMQWVPHVLEMSCPGESARQRQGS